MKSTIRWFFAWALALTCLIASVFGQAPAVQRIIVPGTVTKTGSVIIGFGISEVRSDQKNRYLIRAYGTGGESGLKDTVLSLYDKYGQMAVNDDWSSGDQGALIREYSIQAQVTSALDTLSSAIAVTLSPGSYTVQVNGFFGQVGNVIVEVLELPNQMPILGDIVSMFGPVSTDGNIYYVSATDLDGDTLDYFVDYNNDGEWDQRSIRSYPSGERFHFGRVLPPGRHTITVGARDSRGAGTSKSITVDVIGGKG